MSNLSPVTPLDVNCEFYNRYDTLFSYFCPHQSEKNTKTFQILKTFQLLNRQKIPLMLYFHYNTGENFTLKWKIDILDIIL